MPLKNAKDEVIGVAQAINKISAREEPFNKHDEKVSCVVPAEFCSTFENSHSFNPLITPIPSTLYTLPYWYNPSF